MEGAAVEAVVEEDLPPEGKVAVDSSRPTTRKMPNSHGKISILSTFPPTMTKLHRYSVPYDQPCRSE
jgi:hypothetical protein